MQFERVVRRSPFGLVFVLLLFVATTSHGEGDVPKATLETVRQSFAVIDDVLVEVDVYSPLIQAADRKKPSKTRKVWGWTRSGKSLFQSSDRVSIEDSSPPVWERTCYDGQVELGIRYGADGSQVQGWIGDAEEAPKRFLRKLAGQTEFVESWGLLVEQRSLPEWISDDGARLLRDASVNGLDCQVIEVPAKGGLQPAAYRFYLSKEHNLAQVRLEYLVEGKPVVAKTATELQEVADGVWAPRKGHIDPHGRRVPAGYVLQPYSFEVLSLKVNEGIPESLFEVDFKPGLPVFDARFGMETIWQEGLDPSSPQLQREMGINELENLALAGEHWSQLPSSVQDAPAAGEKRPSGSIAYGSPPGFALLFFCILGVALAAVALFLLFSRRGSVRGKGLRPGEE